MNTHTALTPHEDGHLALTITGWIHEHSGSSKTQTAYTQTLNQFKDWLANAGLCLADQDETSQVQIAFLAQAYASHSARDGKQVKPATQNQRLAILSSFYEYAKQKRLVKENPIDAVKRGKVQAYAGARALSEERTQAAFKNIDKGTLAGKRDYALLAILLQTGRRLQEVATLQLQHCTYEDKHIVLSFEHCKGAKQMRDALPLPVSTAFLTWLTAYYGPDMRLGMPGDARQVWLALSRGGKRGTSYGQALGTQAVADICYKHLGTSKVHAMRHTFAHSMEKIGASVSQIQARLGHESLATTGRYLAQLKQEENPHADRLAALLGIE